MITLTRRRMYSPIMMCMSWMLIACNPIEENEARPQQLGEECGSTEACAGGLVCSARSICVAFGDPGSAGPGEACQGSSDCQIDLFCSGLGRCSPVRSGIQGDTCFGEDACRADLICNHESICATPGDEGTTPASGDCDADADCAYGLVCGVDAQCVPIPITPGVVCPESDPTEAPQMRFEVPRIQDAQGPFFALPFPNDVRQRDGQLDLWGYPSPEGATLITPYADAVTFEGNGFGLNPAVILRFNTNIDFSTLTFGGDDATLVFVDVTPDAPSKGRRPRARFFATTSRTRYICANWLAIRPSEGSPLEADRTYAVYLLAGLTATDGRPLVPSADLTAVLGERRPVEPALAAAWSQYTPLRNWLTEEGVSADRVIGATVFTTGDPTQPVVNLPTTTNAVAAPQLSDITECDAGATSPCEGGGARTCGEANPLFREIHGRVNVPDLLQGNPPYLNGGSAIFNDDGTIRVQGNEEVCVGLSVPQGTPPAGGWPTVLYAHGTGGSFREFVTNGFAARMAQLGYAVVSYDGVLHGPRRGADPDPDVPLARRLMPLDRPYTLRDLRIQGAADLHHVARLVDAPINAPGGAVSLDPNHLTFFGDGLGGEVGALFLSATDRIRAAVLNATGGQVLQVLLARQDESRLRAQLQLSFADDELNGMHPGINLIQAHLDGVDPVNIGPQLTFQRGRERPMHLFVLYGAEDVSTPAASIHSLAISARLPLLAPIFNPLDAVDEAGSTSVRGNFTVGGNGVTRGLKQYGVDDSDPAQVAFEAQEAIEDVDRFLNTLLSDPEGVPTIGQ
ncbi:MAG: alpha/beta hydrolase family protein [Bradymonadia bacterium]